MTFQGLQVWRQAYGLYLRGKSVRLTLSRRGDARPDGWGRLHGPAAEVRWHMVFTEYRGELHPVLVGPLSASGVVHFTEGAEILWVRFKLGTFMPHLPARQFRDTERVLPGAAARDSFWLHSSTWQSPDFENVETFVERLAREGTLVRDPLVASALTQPQPDVPPRTLRHRFLQATGQSHAHIRQFERAQQAAELLERGVSILETVHQVGYYDQPHLTRELKRFTGHTPKQWIEAPYPETMVASAAD